MSCKGKWGQTTIIWTLPKVHRYPKSNSPLATSALATGRPALVIVVIGDMVIGDRQRLFLSLGKSACQEIIVVPNCVCFAQYHGSALPGNRSSSFAICEQPLGGLYWQRPSVCKYRLDRATDKPSLPPPRHISTARAHSPPTVTALMIIARAFAGFGQP